MAQFFDLGAGLRWRGVTGVAASPPAAAASGSKPSPNVRLGQQHTDCAANSLGWSLPGDLPVQAPAKYDMAINLKTGKTLGLTVPQSLLLRANEVIQY
jgi:ABC-type uncharacterized transport system substrate-binding protein